MAVLGLILLVLALIALGSLLLVTLAMPATTVPVLIIFALYARWEWKRMTERDKAKARREHLSHFKPYSLPNTSLNDPGDDLL